uniref:NADH dehydrogenase subunit 2 n=1 Tax=Angiostrongylus costaricensis TaxID=334426 RepID=A0A0K1L541_ANGCS|nr:NADH dehydrogenase subunit 2 [Angiostrongylus costaricensis]BAV82624.1 NADH dehydrogenase subunit 2 [Angiostrongylus costaricensis]
MYILFFFFVIFLSLFIMLVSNVFFWWGVFLVMTLLIVFMNKKIMSYSSIFNYFVLQESLGLVFLLLFFSFFPVLIMMIKIGIAPFHFWLFKVVSGMYSFNLVWFLTIHKLPFLLVFLQLFFLNIVFLLLVGMLLCLFQLFVMKSFKSMLVISSVESFNWVLVSLSMSFFNVFYLIFYYLFLMMFLIYKFDVVGNLGTGFSWELVLVFMNMPFSLGFFIKIMMLMEFLKGFGIYMILIMMMMFMSILSLNFWLMILSSKMYMFNKYNVVSVMYVFPLMMLVLL